MKKVIIATNSKGTCLGFWSMVVKPKIFLTSTLLSTLLLCIAILVVSFTTGFANSDKYTSQSDSANRKGILTNNNKGDKMPSHSKVSVVIQYFQGCPHAPKMLKNVKKAIKGLEKLVHYEEVLVESQKQAEKIGFRGSPTLLINGHDLEDMPVPKVIGLTCRVYRGGIPNSNIIKKKILELLK